MNLKLWPYIAIGVFIIATFFAALILPDQAKNATTGNVLAWVGGILLCSIIIGGIVAFFVEGKR